MRWTCLLVGFLVALAFQPARAGHTPPKVVLRVHVQTTGEGLSQLEATKITIPPNNEQILVRSLPELSEGELIDIRQDMSGNVRLLFNHVGQVDLNAVTSQNQGRILVVIVDGVVVYAPTIDQQINSGELDIPHPIPPEIVQQLKELAMENVRKAAKS